MATRAAVRGSDKARGETRLMLRQHSSIEIDEKLDLVALLRLLSDYRRTVLLTTVIFGIAAGTYAFLATPIFRAEITVTAVKDRQESGSGLGGQLGDIANLAGVNLGNNADGQAAKAVLGSRHLIQVFIERYGLLPILRGRAAQAPTLWRGVNRFHDNILSINDDSRKGVTIIAMNWTEPAVAARWANDFVALANELIRTKALNEAKRNVDYLTEQTAKTSSVDMQQALYNLIYSETKKLMLANERVEYAFAVADPAVAPEIRSSPKRKMLLLGGVGFGLFVGISIAFVRARLASRRQQAPPAA
jgi:uncharacterized protein involved in exopolysaccharide biosynthesis